MPADASENDLHTLDEFLEVSPREHRRQFVVAVDRRELANALHAFATAGVLLPAVADQELVESSVAEALQAQGQIAERKRRWDESKARNKLSELRVPRTGLSRFLGSDRRLKEKVADLQSGQIDEWSKEFTLIQSEILANLGGHDSAPKTGDLYAVHPNDSGRYLKVDKFFDTLLVEKLADATSLVQSLGPKSLSISLYERKQTEGRGSVGAGGAMLMKLGLQRVQAGAGAKSSKLRHETCKAEYERQSAAPAVPDHLVWLAEQPEFRSLVEGRLTHGQVRSETSFRFEKSYGLDQQLEAKLAGLKLKQDADFSTAQEQHFQVDVEWWPIEASDAGGDSS